MPDAETPRSLEAARAVAPEETAPPGERLGFTGWLRRLGFQTMQPPRRIWRRQMVSLVSDESDLTSYVVGPRAVFGSNFTTGAGDNLAFQIIAGEHGCRVMVDVQCEVAVTTVSFGIIAPIVLNAPTAPATANPLTMYLDDAAQPLFGSRAFVGGISAATLAATLPVNDSPSYFIRTASVAANSQFHIGGGQVNKPRLWLAPNRALLVVFRSGAATFAYLNGYLEEPGSAPR